MRHKLRIGAQLVYVTMKKGVTHALYGLNFEIEYSPDSDLIEIYFDLSGNLRTRNKQTNQYIDAKDLESSTDSIDYVQLIDKKTIERIYSHLKKFKEKDVDYSLYLNLMIENNHRFEIELKHREDDLILKKV
jgi:hypothetical protein